MAKDLTAFHNSLKNIKGELEVLLAGGEQAPELNSALFQKFLYYSVNYVTSLSQPNELTRTDQMSELADWFPVLSCATCQILRHHSRWDQKCLSPQNMVSYLSNISYKLMPVHEVPLNCHKFLWWAMLQVLALDSQLPTLAPDLAASIAQKGCKILRMVGQKAEAAHPPESVLHQCLELYLLGAVLTCLDPTSKPGNSLKLVQGVLNNWFWSSQARLRGSAQPTDLQHHRFLSGLVDMAVTGYTIQTGTITADAGLVFYVELFRLVMDDQKLREKILACDGDLFKYDLDLSGSQEDIPDEGTAAVRARNKMSGGSSDQNSNSALPLVLGILTFIHELKSDIEIVAGSVEQEHKNSQTSERPGQRVPVKRAPVKRAKTELQAKKTTDHQATVEAVQKLQKESAGSATSPAVTDSLAVLTHSLPRSLASLGSDKLVITVRLTAASVHWFVQDILLAAKRNQAELLSQRINTLRLITSSVMALLDILLPRNHLGVEDVAELAELVKSTLTSLHLLVEAAGSKKVVSPDLSKHLLAIMKKAMADLGTVGRKLTRLGLYSVAISLLSPLWPVTRNEELLPAVCHHSVLCESYLKTSQPELAWAIISKAAVIDVSLLSEPVISVLIKVLKQEASWSVVKLFESCQDQAEKSLHLFMMIARKLTLSQSPTSLRHASFLLRRLISHKSLSETDRAAQEFLLAQTLWSESEDKERSLRECLDLLHKAMGTLHADTSHSLDDILAQAAFLYWNLLGQLSNQDSDQQAQMDSEVVMMKARTCLQVWSQWYKTRGGQVLQEQGTFRLETSLRFLQRLAEYAVLNYRVEVAVTALCQAHQVAVCLKRADVTREVVQSLLTLIPRLGLQVASASHDSDSGDDQDCLLNSLNSGDEGNLLLLMAIAAHHLRTRQLHKFLVAREHASKLVHQAKEKGLRTCSLYTALAVLSRLDAEFSALPSAGRIVADNPTQGSCVLELAGESIKNIKNVMAFHLGEDFQSVNNKGSSLDVWNVVQEYLVSLKLYGELCLHIGSAKYAKTYFTEGLVTARKFQLTAWSAVFSTCLVRLALLTHDSAAEAQHLLQNAVSILKKHGVLVDKDGLDSFSVRHCQELENSKTLSNLLLGHKKVKVGTRAQSSGLSFEDDDLGRGQLMPPETAGDNSWWSKQLELDDESQQWEEPVFLGGASDLCLQQDMADTCADLISSQAQILWRNKEPVSSSTSVLHASLYSSLFLNQMISRKSVEDVLREGGLGFSCVPQNKFRHPTRVIDAVYRLAEIKFQSLYLDGQQGVEDSLNQDIVEIEDLLEIIDREELPESVEAHVLRASALLLKSHLNYLPLLRELSYEKGHVSDGQLDSLSIAAAVELARKEKQHWDEDKQSRLKFECVNGNENMLKSTMGKVVPVSGERKILHKLNDNTKTKMLISSSIDNYNVDRLTSTKKSPQVLTEKIFNENLATVTTAKRRGRQNLQKRKEELADDMKTPQREVKVRVRRRPKSPEAIRGGVIQDQQFSFVDSPLEVITRDDSSKFWGNFEELNESVSAVEHGSLEFGATRAQALLLTGSSTNYDGQSLANYDGQSLANYDGQSLANYDGQSLANYDCQSTISPIKQSFPIPEQNSIYPNMFLSPIEIPRGKPQRKTEKQTLDSVELKSRRVTRRREHEKAVSSELEVNKKDSPHETSDFIWNSPQAEETPRLLGGMTHARDHGYSSANEPHLKLTPAQDLLQPNIVCRTSLASTLKKERTSRKRQQANHFTSGISVDVCLETKGVNPDQPAVACSLFSQKIMNSSVDSPTLSGRFPTLACSHPVSGRIESLQCGLAHLSQFPQSFLYRKITQSLALCLWEKHMKDEGRGPDTAAQSQIAAYLTESMQPMFQHMMVKNLHHKIRKCHDHKTTKKGGDARSDWSQPRVEQAVVEEEAMKSALSLLTFGGDIIQQFQERLGSFPPDWTIAQVTVVDLDPAGSGCGQIFITRLTSQSEPLTVALPCHKFQDIEGVLRLHEVAVEHKVDNLSPEQHWKYRHQQDQNMQNLVYFLQEVILEGHKWLLKGQLPSCRQGSVHKLLKQAAEDTCRCVLQEHGCHISPSTVQNLLEILLPANEKEVAALVECVWPSHIARTVVRACLTAQESVMKASLMSVDEKRAPLILILDSKLNRLPWESMPLLFEDEVTRVPSLASLHAMLQLHKGQPRSVFRRGVDREDVVAVIPPDTDLLNAVNCLVPQFQQYPGWTCLVQKAPTLSELQSCLTDHSLYLYCGHSWGHQYVSGRDVQMFKGRAVAVLMGCGSGKLEHSHKLDGDGGPLYFLLAGCPAVIGNLWLVTDKDIDKLTSHLFSLWQTQTTPVSLGLLLSSARKVCRLLGLTGFAPVIYGLPIMMN